MIAPRARRAGDIAFAAGLGLYLVGALAVLAEGLLAVAAARAPALHEWLHLRSLDSGPLARTALRAADASHRVPAGGQVTLDYLFSVIHLTLAGILLWLRPRDPCSRLLGVALVGAAGIFNLTAQAVFEQLPMTTTESVAQSAAHVVTGLAYIYALLLFPDGRPVPRWRAAALVPLYSLAVVVAIVLPTRVEGAARPATLLVFFGLVVPAAGAAAQWYRIRHTPDVTGQAQARLVFWALLPSVAVGLLFVVTHGLSVTETSGLVGRHLPGPPVAIYRGFQAVFALIPLALFAGLLRYRLWDIERLLNRTLVYAAATGLLGGVYVAFVVTVQQALGSVAASPIVDGRLAVAVTTLVLASIFRPLRDRVQRFVDRRFHRHRYDAHVTVERFTRRLRDEVELDRIADDLYGVLDEALEPRSATLWLADGRTTEDSVRPGDGRGREADAPADVT